MSKGSIIKRPRKDGTNSWLLKYDIGPDPKTGKRRQGYETVRSTRREAERILRNLLKQVDDGTHVVISDETVTEWLRRWLRDYAPMECESKVTLDRYEQFVERHLIPEIGHIKLQKLTTGHVQRLYAEKLSSGRLVSDGGLSKRTVHHMHRLLSNALSTAMSEGLLNRNPCSTAKTPKPGKPDIKVLDDEQTAELLKAATTTQSENLYALIVLAVTTALRRGELLALKWSRVDLDACTIEVVATLEETKEGLRFKETKSDTSKRIINLPAFTVNVLREHKAAQSKLRLRLGAGASEDQLVFENFDIDAGAFSPVRPRNMTKAFSRFIKTVDVPQITLHGLRHTHATSAIRAGENIVAVSRRLGHAAPSITLDVYSHFIPGDDADIATNLDVRLMGYMR